METKQTKMKLTKRIQKKENYYLNMTEKGHEIHITNKNDEVIFSATMQEDGTLNIWRSSSEIIRKTQFQRECEAVKEHPCKECGKEMQEREGANEAYMGAMQKFYLCPDCGKVK